jgi:hypothetical protein
MTSINFHFIDARGALIDHRDWLHTRLLETYPSGQVIYPAPQGQDMVCT